MNKVEVCSSNNQLLINRRSLQTYAVKVLNEIGHGNWVLSIYLCDDNAIKQLNSKFRNKNEATDVLSFEMGVEEQDCKGKIHFIAGDIAISLETMRQNAKYFKISEDEELRRLIIHGILHLSGMDHQTNNADEPMLLLQEKILGKVGGRVINEE